MIRSDITIILLFSSLTLAGQANDSVRFKVSIIQDAHEYLINNNVIRLKREPFTFRIAMNLQVELSVNASFDSSIYLHAINGFPSIDLKCFGDGAAMTAILKNIDRDISVTNESYNVWLYENDSIHTFSDVNKQGDAINCKMEIDRLNVVSYPERGQQIAHNEPLIFENVSEDLFLVFVDRIYRRDAHKYVDMYKVTCRIEWE